MQWSRFRTRWLIVLSFTMLAVVGGCSSENQQGRGVELTWLVRSNPDLIEWEHRVIEEFEAEHPNIQVRLQVIPQGEIDQKLQTMIAGGNVPDVWSPNWADSGFGTYYGLGALKNLSPLIEQDPDIIDGIDDSLIDIYTMDDGVYGLPILSMGSFVYYNKDLFDEAGLEYPPTDWDDKSWDWDKMIEYGQAITDKSKSPTERVYGVLNNNTPNKNAWLFGGDFF